MSVLTKSVSIASDLKESTKLSKKTLPLFLRCFANIDTISSCIINIDEINHADTIKLLIEGKLDHAIEKGYSGINQSNISDNNELKLMFNTTLVLALMFLKNFNKIFVILNPGYIKEVKLLSSQDNQGMYFSCCYNLWLDSGIIIENPETCIGFSQAALDEYPNLFDGSILFFLASCLALSYARKGDLSKCEQWFLKTCSMRPIRPCSLLEALGISKMYETVLVVYSNFIGKVLEIDDKEIIELKIQQVQSLVLHSLFRFPLLKPRFLHYNAYLEVLNERNNAAHKLIKKSQKLAEKSNNQLDLDWALRSEKIWFGSGAKHNEKVNTEWQSILAFKKLPTCINPYTFLLPAASISKPSDINFFVRMPMFVERKRKKKSTLCF